MDTHIIIYDITESTKLLPSEYLCVTDHINMTGDNPLIGNQHIVDKPFIDISDMYAPSSSYRCATTHCLGKYFDQEKQKHDYPSKYLCHISIIAKATGHKNISAFLKTRPTK